MHHGDESDIYLLFNKLHLGTVVSMQAFMNTFGRKPVKMLLISK